MTAAQIDIRQAARALGGDVAGRNKVRCPGPGHSRADRSLAVTFRDDSFLVHSFAGDDWKECRDHVKAALGLSDDHTPAPQASPSDDVSLLVDDRRRIEHASRLWSETVPLAGTLAESYLRSRKLAYDGDALRYHPGKQMLVGLMTDVVTGEPCGVHRTFLDAEGNRTAKKMLGRAKGAIVRLSPDEDVATGLGIAEGLETALATGFQPVWACLSAGTIKAFPVLSGIEALTIFADHDRAGIEAANECGRRWHGAGREVTIIAPSDIGADFADLAEAA